MKKQNWIVDASINGIIKSYTVKYADKAHLSRIATKVAASLFCCDKEDVVIKSQLMMK